MRSRSAYLRTRAYLRRALLSVASLSLLFGLFLETLLLLLDPAAASVPGVAQKAGRAFVICSGLAVGTMVLDRRVQAVGLAGLAAGPLGFYAGRFLHAATARLLDLPDAAGAATLELALLKGIEYGCLGVTLGWLGRRSRSGPGAYALAGIAVGVVFGGIILGFTGQSVSTTSQAVNELLNPVGCAIILFVAEAAGRRGVGEEAV